MEAAIAGVQRQIVQKTEGAGSHDLATGQDSRTASGVLVDREWTLGVDNGRDRRGIGLGCNPSELHIV